MEDPVNLTRTSVEATALPSATHSKMAACSVQLWQWRTFAIGDGTMVATLCRARVCSSK